jgi:hypothetical protein
MWWMIGAVIAILALWAKHNVDEAGREEFRRRVQRENDEYERSNNSGD